MHVYMQSHADFLVTSITQGDDFLGIDVKSQVKIISVNEKNCKLPLDACAALLRILIVRSTSNN